QPGGEAALEPDGRVAQPDRPMPPVQEGLGDDADRVGEVHEPGPGGAPAHGLFGQLEHDRDGAQGLGEAARPGRLLADAAELQRQGLVHQAHGLPADPELDDHEVGPVDGLLAAAGPVETTAPAGPGQHAPGQAGDHVQTLGVDVEQDQLVDRQAGPPGGEALDQLRGVGAATPDHRDLQAHGRPLPLGLRWLYCAATMSRLGKFSYSTAAAILAVDGGNSKTDVALVDATGAVLGAARGPGASHHHLGVPAAMEALEALIEAAGHDAGLPATERPLAAVGVWCLAGVDFPADDQALGPAIAGRRWASETLLRNDVFAVRRAGSGRTWGVGVVAGAGMNCVGVAPDGGEVRFAAIGELSGDWGGGRDVGVAAVGAALRGEDGRGPRTTPTPLLRA